MSQTGWTDKRPMAPHLWSWRWHVTMWVSILHRATGMALYAGAALIAAWLFALAMGPETYGDFAALAASLVGQVVLFGFTLAFLFHALNGVRHLVWDAGYGFTPALARFTAWIIIVLALVGAAAIWWAAGLIPGAPGLFEGAYP